MAIQYRVDTIKDDSGSLLIRLQEIANEGGKIVSVTWQPNREDEHGARIRAGYTVVSEFNF